MKTIPLTQGFVALVDDADYERVSAFKWCANKNKHTVYAYRKDNRRTVYLHRFVSGITNPKEKVDHEDHNGLNCQRYNLRVCSNGQNNMNQKKRSDGLSSRFKGVTVRSGKRGIRYHSQIRVAGRSRHIGAFMSEVDAALAYDAAAREHFGEFALCNFPPKMPCIASAPALVFAHGDTSA